MTHFKGNGTVEESLKTKKKNKIHSCGEKELKIISPLIYAATCSQATQLPSHPL